MDPSGFIGVTMATATEPKLREGRDMPLTYRETICLGITPAGALTTVSQQGAEGISVEP